MQQKALYRLANAGAACVSPALVFLLLLSMTSATTPSTELIKETLIQRFRTTTGEALYEVWHGDCHRRCRSALVDHVNLACHYDPYRMRSRRSLPNFRNTTSLSTTTVPPQLTLQHEESAAFLEKKSAVRARMGGHHVVKRGIMEECCYLKSCSWEEYGEFCHGYNRRPNRRPSVC